MSNCGSCGSQTICTCSFNDGENASVTGSGRVTQPINYRPDGVPLPRPSGMMRKTSEQTILGLEADVLVWNSDESMYDSGMIFDFITIGLVAPVAGYYLTGAFMATDTNEAQLIISRNGYVFGVGTTTVATTNGHVAGGISVMGITPLNAGEMLQVWVIAPAADVDIVYSSPRVMDPFIPVEVSPIFWVEYLRPL